MTVLTQKIVRELLSYDPKTGLFTWRERDRTHFTSNDNCLAWNDRFVGEPAFITDKNGFEGCRLFGYIHKAGKIARLYLTGSITEPPINKRVKLKQRNRSISILDAINDPNLFAPWFRNRDTWEAWMTFLCALFDLPMTKTQYEIYHKCTKRECVPAEPAHEAWLVVGRRGGKSFIMALVAVFLGCFRDYKQFLAPGEKATIMIVSADRKQSRIIIRYVKALMTRIPMLKQLIEREDQFGLDLTNQVTIEVHTASFKSTRGYSLAACILDELAFFPTDDHAAEVDREILNSLRPGLATIPNSLLLCASSPYARRGSLWEAYRKHHGVDNDPVLVWQAPTRTMNPSIPQRIINSAIEDDEASAKAEYLAQFRTDIEQFITREVVDACVSHDVKERGRETYITYKAFCDPAGGSGSDSFTICLGHYDREQQTVIVDALREVPPRFDPDEVAREFSGLLKSYGVTSVMGDRYAGSWPASRFQAHGIKYESCEKPKSTLYLDALPLLNSRRIQLLDNKRLFNQLVSLERRTTRGTGKDIIDHPRGQHDDLVNVMAGLASMLTVRKSSYVSDLSWVRGADEPVSYLAQLQQQTGRMFG